MQTQSISVISFLYIYILFFFSLGERCVVMHGALRGCVQGQGGSKKETCRQD